MVNHQVSEVRRELHAVYEVGKTLATSLDIGKTFREALNYLVHAMDWRRAFVVLADADQELHGLCAVGLSPEEQQRLHFHSGEGIVGRVYATGVPASVADVRAEPLFLNRTGAAGLSPDAGVSMLATPIRADRRTVGVLAIDYLNPHQRNAFDEQLQLLRMVATLMGLMNFDKVAKAQWFDRVLPFEIAGTVFDSILTMTLVMILVMIESTGIFLALGEMTDRKVDQAALTRGLRTDGLGSLLGGIFNTFPYTSFSQNVGLVSVSGLKSRFVCVAGGVILNVLGVLPKMAALVESLPTTVLGGAGRVMFGMVAATGIRILGGVDFKTNRFNAMIVAVSIGVGMVPLIAPNFRQWMPHAIHPLIESGILLASITAVALNVFFNGASRDTSAAVNAARQADAH